MYTLRQGRWCSYSHAARESSRPANAEDEVAGRAARDRERLAYQGEIRVSRSRRCKYCREHFKVLRRIVVPQQREVTIGLKRQERGPRNSNIGRYVEWTAKGDASIH